ncbi:uncharacterized protein LOC108045212 [Drosophila rhopaloa]|uniref:Uncharacterized protein LOC108045212 n=1 Tax=Drosophila rhopaloa TaxID=1041015 RepID=A0A6P4EPA5_DRORH|nr:uncharacterized protein LOC108045212 [Drosophila rhopaloa]
MTSSDKETPDITEEPPMPLAFELNEDSFFETAGEQPLVPPTESRTSTIIDQIESPTMNSDEVTPEIEEKSPRPSTSVSNEDDFETTEEIPPPAPVKLRRSKRIQKRKENREEQEATSSEVVAPRKRRKVMKPKSYQSDVNCVTCYNCGIVQSPFPPLTKFYQCAEVNGRLFRIRRLPSGDVLGSADRKKPLKRVKKTIKKSAPPKDKPAKDD